MGKRKTQRTKEEKGERGKEEKKGLKENNRKNSEQCILLKFGKITYQHDKMTDTEILISILSLVHISTYTLTHNAHYRRNINDCARKNGILCLPLMRRQSPIAHILHPNCIITPSNFLNYW